MKISDIFRQTWKRKKNATLHDSSCWKFKLCPLNKILRPAPTPRFGNRAHFHITGQHFLYGFLESIEGIAFLISMNWNNSYENVK